MADDKTKTDARDQDYVVAQFALHHGISHDQARSLIEKFGNDRQALMREVPG